MRRPPGEHEVDTLVRAHVELGNGGLVLSLQFHLGAQNHQVRAQDGAEPAAIVQLRHPRRRGTVVEPHGKVQPHPHSTAPTLDAPHHRGVFLAIGHEVDQCDTAFGGFEPRLQHHRIAAVAACRGGRGVNWADLPASVPRGAQQCRKTGAAVEPRPAEPIDRPIAADQRPGQTVAYERVILDTQRLAGLC